MSRLGVVVLVIAAVGCKRGGDKPASRRPPPIPPAEVNVGKAACDDLVERVCACAAARPDDANLRDRCELDRARPEALALALDTAARPDLASDAVIGAQSQVRLIIDKCVSAVAALPSLGCN